MPSKPRIDRWTCFVLLSSLLVVATAHAKTPDGQTPAEETACDVMLDATPGLYGLCVAFCEAQDCDSIDQVVSGQCQAPSPRLLDLFDRKRAPSDPEMPCLTPPTTACSCFTSEDLMDLSLRACFDDVDHETIMVIDGQETNGAMVQVGDGWGTCALVDDGFSVVVEISEDEALACDALIREAAYAQGMTCQ